MADRTRVPDAFFHLALWLGIIAAVCLLGCGFAARAADQTPWPWWIGSAVPFLPLALIVWLEKSGRIELIDTEKIEQRRVERAVAGALARAPRRWRLPLLLTLTVAGSVIGGILSYVEGHSDAYGGRLEAFAGRFAHPEYAAWLIAAAGLLGAAYETVVVIRDRRRP